jgi:hypothetical protein
MSTIQPNVTGRKTLLRRTQAAQYVVENYGFPLAAKTLAKMAVTGGGPPFRRAGRFPLYDPNDLDRWAEEKIGPLQASTSATVLPTTDEKLSGAV